jgi:UDP-glucose-4-epimerase GalE
MRIFVTGGAGYIGSHTCKRLAGRGHEIAVYDDLSRGHRDFVKWGRLVEGRLRDRTLLREALQQLAPDAVIHFAAFAYVGESVGDPQLYYENNVLGTLSLLAAMREACVNKLIFSSSCAIYGQPERIPITEETVQQPVNPYGASKLMAEQICRDFEKAYGLNFVALRYFNACGGDPEREIGERHEPETHLIPRALMAADGQIKSFEIYGDDYATPDGTCIRDFVHVNDLADAHIAAAMYLAEGGKSDAFNIGTGRGVSVREILSLAERVAGKSISRTVRSRREGDPAVLVADVSKARGVLDWKPRYSDLETIVSTAWEWHRKERARAAKRC